MRTIHRPATTIAGLPFLLLLVARMSPAQESPKPSFTGKSGVLNTNPGTGFFLTVDLTVGDATILVNKMTTKPLVIWVETGATAAKESSIRIPLDDVGSFAAKVLSRASQAKSFGTIAFSHVPFALTRKNPYLKDALDLMKVKSGFIDFYIDTEDATCLLVKSTNQAKFLKVEPPDQKK